MAKANRLKKRVLYNDIRMCGTIILTRKISEKITVKGLNNVFFI